MKEYYFNENKIVLYETCELISLIENENVIICGLSELTKNILERNDISKNIDSIFDNKIGSIGSYHAIPIISENKLIDINKNKVIIIWGNHTVFFYKQISELGFKNIYLQYSFRTFIELLDIEFVIETPDYQISYGESTYHKFVPLLVEELLKYNQKISMQPIGRHTKKNLLKDHDVKTKQLLFSFHSIGESYNNIIRIKDGYLHNSITFDSKGFSGWHSLSDENIEKELLSISEENANYFYKNFVLKYIDKNLSKYEQKKSDNLFSFPDTFIFFPLQTIDDSVMDLSYFEPLSLIKDIIELLDKKCISLVIKRHPRCTSTKLDLLLKKYILEDKVVLYDGSIHEAIAKAKTIYSINSGVGFESLLHLKPVISFGKSDYMSVTKNIKDLLEIEKEPFYILIEKEKLNIKKFLYYYLENKNIFIDNQKSIKKLVSSFITNYLKKSYKD